jgi:predicted aminopeptidase
MRALLLLSAALLAGCETLSYYGQAAGGQLALMARAQPVGEVQADAVLRERLARATAIRDFASRELALPDNSSYRSYAGLDRPYALWNVVAAPEFSLAPVRSCFPVAGCVAYRGYYAEEGAERYARARREEGYDVIVYGVPAYSTLGWFDDPLLSTFIHYPEADLARLIFHELAHQVAYAKGDSTFNESFAVVVEREGLRRWLAAQGRTPGALRDIGPEIAAARATLGALYRSRLAPDAMRARKREVMESLRPLLQRIPSLQGQAPNNAFLASYATYNEMVPMFEKLLAEEGGDLRAFYARVKRLVTERSTPGPSSAPRP